MEQSLIAVLEAKKKHPPKSSCRDWAAMKATLVSTSLFLLHDFSQASIPIANASQVYGEHGLDHTPDGEWVYFPDRKAEPASQKLCRPVTRRGEKDQIPTRRDGGYLVLPKRMFVVRC